MLTDDTIQALAHELYQARKTRTALRHFSAQHPGMTIDDGYAIQRAWVALELADGRTIQGRKIGLTSRAMQLSSQIDEPDYAPLMDDMFFEPGAIPLDRFIAPRVEVELAFILGQPLAGPGVTLDDVIAAAVEQERLEGWIMGEVERGVPLPGLYPPNAEAQARYKAWKSQNGL